MTASPEMLTLMLWDGAIRFAEQGKEAIQKKEIEGSYKALVRSQRIITELTSNLKHEINPDLCQKLVSLYNFIYRRLVDANIQKEAKLVDDALELMKHQRETWAMLMDKLVKERAVEAQATVTANADAIATAEATSAAVENPGALPAGVGGRMPAVPARRTYPGLAVRPAPAVASLSVQG
jgi:flagellar protein FliS